MPENERLSPKVLDKENADPAWGRPRPVIDLTGVQPDDTNDGDVARFTHIFDANALNGVQPGLPIDVSEPGYKLLQEVNEAIAFLSLIGMCQPVSGVKLGINGVKPDLCLPFIV